MKPLLVVLVSTVALAAMWFANSYFPAASAASKRGSQAVLVGPPRVHVLYGHLESLSRKGSRFELRFDPAWWLGGSTANRAAVEDKVIQPGEPVPNDYYIREDGHKLLTYVVPAGARATVITNSPSQGLRSTTIAVSELAQIVKGKNPRRRSLLDRGNNLGYWLRVALDTVRSLDQQYQP